jgi:hypothetical protein
LCRSSAADAALLLLTPRVLLCLQAGLLYILVPEQAACCPVLLRFPRTKQRAICDYLLPVESISRSLLNPKLLLVHPMGKVFPLDVIVD